MGRGLYSLCWLLYLFDNESTLFATSYALRKVLLGLIISEVPYCCYLAIVETSSLKPRLSEKAPRIRASLPKPSP